MDFTKRKPQVEVGEQVTWKQGFDVLLPALPIPYSRQEALYVHHFPERNLSQRLPMVLCADAIPGGFGFLDYTLW
jgi:hypothetical protein